MSLPRRIVPITAAAMTVSVACHGVLRGVHFFVVHGLFGRSGGAVARARAKFREHGAGTSGVGTRRLIWPAPWVRPRVGGRL